MNSTEDIVQGQVMLHSKSHLAQHFSCTRTDYVRTYNFVLLTRQNQLDKTGCLVFSLSTIDFSPRKLHNTHLFVLFLSILGSQTYTCRLRIGKGTPRHDTIINLLLAHRHQCISYRDSGLVDSNMREEVTPYHISHGQDIGGRSLEIVIDLDTVFIIFDIGSLQVQPLNIRLTPHGQYNLIG